MDHTSWETDAERVVWAVHADDPWGLIERPEDADPDTAVETARRVAEEHGIRFEGVYDTDDVEGVNYYQWWLDVPREHHDSRATDRPPRAVEAVMIALRAELGHDSLRWDAYVDGELTWWHHAAALVREAHRPLLNALETVLLPLRVDGAEDVPPRIGVQRLDGNGVEGHYSVALCAEGGMWCVLRAGVAVDLPPPDSVHRNAATRGSLILPMPPPAGPVVYGATVSTGPYLGLASRWESTPSVVAWGGPKKTWPGVGASHTWLANDPQALADKMARTVALWWPENATPPAGETGDCLAFSGGLA